MSKKQAKLHKIELDLKEITCSMCNKPIDVGKSGVIGATVYFSEKSCKLGLICNVCYFFKICIQAFTIYSHKTIEPLLDSVYRGPSNTLVLVHILLESLQKALESMPTNKIITDFDEIHHIYLKVQKRVMSSIMKDEKDKEK